MSRRATLPGADELFRRTSDAPAEPEAAPEPAAAPVALAPAPAEPAEDPAAVAPAGAAVAGSPTRVRATPKRRARAGDLRPTGRERHEEKITVYVSPEELVALEQAKLALRAQHGMAVDRGRIVREAVAVVIADLEAKGEESILVRRLRGL
ncbi:MAG: hypothetical protein AB7O74_14685 [Candidatus Nanopelagicales bacterium]